MIRKATFNDIELIWDTYIGYFMNEDDKIAGAILSGHDGRKEYIYHTAVLPEYRGQVTSSNLA